MKKPRALELEDEDYDVRPLNSAPRDGTWVTLVWAPNGIIEFETRARWRDGEWDGGWTPTHWRP